MSHSTIKNNINRLLKERDWKVAHLEKKLGSTRAVTNILRGSSKNPTIDVLHSIAQAFNVEIQDLLIEQENIDQVNLSLLRDSYTKVIQAIEPISKFVSFTHNNVISLVKETYDYSLKLKLNSADDNFIKWLITQYYNTN